MGGAGRGGVVHLGIIVADLLSRCVEIRNQDVVSAPGCLSTERRSVSPVRFWVHGEDFCASYIAVLGSFYPKFSPTLERLIFAIET